MGKSCAGDVDLIVALGTGDCSIFVLQYVAARSRCNTEAIEKILKTYFSDDYNERKVTHLQELEDFAK